MINLLKSSLVLILMLLVAGCVPVDSDPVTITQQFSYTAAGDDGTVGQADKIQIRMAQDPVLLATDWDGCALVTEQPSWAPLVNDTLTVEIEIETGVPYYFAIKTADEKPNWSGLSNIIELQWADITAPSPIGDFNAVD